MFDATTEWGWGGRSTGVRPLFAIWLISLVLSLGFGACSKKNPGSSSDNTTLSGTITIQGASIHDGIIIEIFERLSADSLWKAARDRYGFIGLDAAQRYIFDHREQIAVATTTSGSDGSFELVNLAEGDYHLVVRKAGFGWRYYLNVTINAGQNSLPGSANLVLYAEETLPAQITGQKTLLSNRHYIAKSNVEVATGARLDIEPGAFLRIDSRQRLTVSGTLISAATPENPARITAASTRDVFAEFDRVLFKASSTGSLSNLIVSFGQTGIKVESGNVSITSSFIRNCLEGILFSRGISRLNKSVVYQCETGIRSELEAEVTIGQCLIIKCDREGIRVFAKLLVENNVFSGSQAGIRFDGRQDSMVRNNLFLADSIGIDVIKNGAFPDIQNNTFESCKRGIQTTDHNSEQRLPVSGNNFLGINEWYFYNITLRVDINAPNNYWDGAAESGINEKIYDGKDYNDTIGESGEIVFMPVSPNPVSSAYPENE